MLLREALHHGLKTLTERDVPSPRLAAELLLMHTLGCDRGELHAHPELDLSPEAAARYFGLIAERLTGKPTQYITGHQEFWGLDFAVTPDVLIPRPETEHVVEAVLDLAKAQGAARDARLRIVDVGTGSGCIALSLASEFPKAEVDAVDISAAALGVASGNAARLGLSGRVRFREGDLLAGLLEEGKAGWFDFVVSNPPYVGFSELAMVQREVKEFEPRRAWGGIDRGDEIYRRLFPEALQCLKPGGCVAVEIGYRMSEAVTGLLRTGWTEIEVRPDLSGIPRVVTARKRNEHGEGSSHE
jgi:release factor glutamine methyltransferase